MSDYIHNPAPFLDCIKKRIESNLTLKDNIFSLIMFGSYVRGDFISGVSDLDFFAVIEKYDKFTISELKKILERCCEKIEAVEIDLAWELKSNLKNPLHCGHPFKFLTIYQEDFLKHHIIIYGEKPEIPKYDFRSLIPFRCSFILQSASHFRKNKKMLHILAGEICRLLAILGGSKSLKKDEIMKHLLVIGDKKAIEIYSAYLEGRKMNFKEKELIEFIESRCKTIIEKYGN